MPKVVNLEDRRNNVTIHYKHGDAVQALRWVIVEKMAAAETIESALQDLIFKNDEESAQRVRKLVVNSIWGHSMYGPD